jgi:hypothetical protein
MMYKNLSLRKQAHVFLSAGIVRDDTPEQQSKIRKGSIQWAPAVMRP